MAARRRRDSGQGLRRFADDTVDIVNVGELQNGRGVFDRLELVDGM